MPTSGGITQARERLGSGPVALVFEAVAVPVADQLTPGGGAGVVAADGPSTGSTGNTPGHRGHVAEFGYAGSGPNASAFPKARVVTISECASHAVVAAESAELLWRVSASVSLPVLAALRDGSYASVLINPKIRGAARTRLVEAARRGEQLDPDRAVAVRVIEYTGPDRAGNASGKQKCAERHDGTGRRRAPAIGSCEPAGTGRAQRSL